VANSHKADAEKILLVKSAEADSESKHLTGLGIARQRKALVDGLQDTVSQFSSDVRPVLAVIICFLRPLSFVFVQVDGTSAKDVYAQCLTS
jgi:hypothetical protein